MNTLNDPLLAAEREARQSASRAAMLSRYEGKAVDEFGFSVNRQPTGKTWAEIQREREAEAMAESTDEAVEFVEDGERAA